VKLVWSIYLRLLWIEVFLGIPFVWGLQCVRWGRARNSLQREAPVRAVALVLSLAGAAWLLTIRVERWIVALTLAMTCAGFVWERRCQHSDSTPKDP
jgi:hypothetical protein